MNANSLSAVDLIIIILSSILCGLVIFLMAKTAKQNWVNNNYMFITFLALPSIGSVITKVISGDIALSLGMVGALSIIRFRTPIKNPLELVVYFLLLTVGISNSVNLIYGIVLTITFGCILLFVKLAGKIMMKDSISNYITLNSRISLSIVTQSKVDSIDQSSNIKEIIKQNDNYNYILEFYDEKTAKDFLREIEAKNSNIEYTINFS